jgi:hypothetical protein
MHFRSGETPVSTLYQRNPRWPDQEEFIRQVDFAVKLYELDPNLPEVQALKDDYDRLSNVRSSRLSAAFYLRKLNPHRSVRIRPDGEVYIAEDPLGDRQLGVASLIRHHVPHVDSRLGRIIADDAGLHLLELPRRRPLATVASLPIDPRRPADPGNRYQAICELILEFTGVPLRWRDHVGHTAVITVTRLDGNWHTTLQPPPVRPQLLQPATRGLLPRPAR